MFLLKSEDSVNEFGFDELCPLSESQLNVYLNEMVEDMGTSYNMPFKIKFSQSYSVEKIKQSIYKLIEIYPILSSRIISNKNNIYLSFDAKPEIQIGSSKDLKSFIQPFELNKTLSKFLIIEEESTLCIDCHHLICDGTSKIILINKLKLHRLHGLQRILQ